MNERPSPASPLLRTALLSMCAVSLVGLTGWLVGLQIWPFVPDWVPTQGAQIGIGAGLLFLATVPPLFVAGRLIRWTAERGAHRPTVTLSTVGLWNAVILMALIGLGLGPGAKLPASDAVEVEVEVREGPWGAAQVFAQRADGVVVVHTQTRLEEGDDGRMAVIARMMGRRIIAGHGSGFVVSDDGVIVTNHHVIEGATNASVALRTGRRLSVTVLAEDPLHDLALLKADQAFDDVLPLRDDDISVGSPTFAIGAPMGFEYSLTEGIVSAVREMSGTRMIQMQTPVAPGSSGGPLLDDAGHVVGVNTAIAGPGMNLAVHVDHVHDLLVAERSPRQLPLAEVPRLRVLQLDLGAAEAHPNDHANFETMIGSVVKGWEDCIETDGSMANVTLIVRTGEEEMSSNLTPAAHQCVEDELGEGWLHQARMFNAMMAADGTAVEASLGGPYGLEILRLRLER